MKSTQKTIILIALGIFIAFSIISNDCSNFNAGKSDDSNFDIENLKISAVSGKIHIEYHLGWSNAKTAGICSGSGTYSNPYVIEDLEIDGGGSGDCIFIENSDVYFRIENCELTNLGGGVGIRFSNIENGQVIDNNCASNNYGISLSWSDNNTISGNTANNNNYHGIYLFNSHYNTVSGNIAKYNDENGIELWNSDHCIISGNTVDNNDKGIYSYHGDSNTFTGNTASNNNEGIEIEGSSSFNNITGNTVSNNQYGIYGSFRENNILSGNTANNNQLCGIFLGGYNGENNNILGNTANNNNIGIKLFYFNDNVLTSNSVNNNRDFGIYLAFSDDNTIQFNTITTNPVGIYLLESDDNDISSNIFSGNGVDVQEGELPPPFDIELVIILVTVILIVTVIIVVSTVILIRKRKGTKDEVAKFYELEEQERQLKDGLALNDIKPSTPRESIIRNAGEVKEKEEVLSNKLIMEIAFGVIGVILLISGANLIMRNFPLGLTLIIIGALIFIVIIGILTNGKCLICFT